MAEEGAVPVLDLRHWHGTPSQRAQLLRDVRVTCAEVGFMLLHPEGHDVPQQLLESAAGSFREFFYLPEEEKEKLAPTCVDADVSSGLWSGYMAQHRKPQTRLRQMFSVTPGGADVRDAQGLARSWGGEEFGPCVGPVGGMWPDATVPSLRKHGEELWDAFQALASLLLQIMGAALGMPEDWAVEAVRTQGITNMVAAHYPAADEAPPPGTLRVAPHSDTSVLTVVVPDAEGLQVLRRTGEWETVPCLAGALVVNLGDLMEIATHGAWVSSKHRVVNHAAAAEDRLSLLFFFSFNPDVVPFTLLPEHAVRAAAEGAEALPPTPTGEKDKRGGFKDNGQMEGAISGEIAMEKVAGYEALTCGQIHSQKVTYRYQFHD